MKNKNLILGLLLVVLVLLIVLPKIVPEDRGYPERLAEIDTSRVTKIEFDQGEEGVALVKSGVMWKLDRPIAFDADRKAVDRLLGVLADLRLAALVTENADFAEDERFELDDEQARRVQVYEGDRLVLEARFGKATQDYSNGFVRNEGDPRVFRTAQNLGGRFNMKHTGWIKRELFTLDKEAMESILVDRCDDGELSFAKAEEGWSVAWVAPRERDSWESPAVETGRFGTLQNALAKLRISDLAPEDKIAELENAEPSVISTVNLAGGQSRQVEWYVLESEESKAYCRVDGGGRWYEVYKSSLNSLEKDPEDYKGKVEEE